MNLSHLGQFHTAISFVSIGSGAYALFRFGKIDLHKVSGKIYLWTMLVASLTAFGIFRHGTFTLGHGLSFLTLVVLAVGVVTPRIARLGHWAPHVENASLSMSYFLLMIFATTETLTRVPVGHPLAAGPEAPLVVAVHTTLLLTFVFGTAWQSWRMKVARV